MSGEAWKNWRRFTKDLAAFIQQSRAQIAQEMLLDNEFFRNTFH